VSGTEELAHAIDQCETGQKGSSTKNFSARLCDYFINKNRNVPKDNMSLVCIDLQYIQRSTVKAPQGPKKLITVQDDDELASLEEAFNGSLIFSASKKPCANTRGSSLFSFC
jgi:hypothetical protein